MSSSHTGGPELRLQATPRFHSLGRWQGPGGPSTPAPVVARHREGAGTALESQKGRQELRSPRAQQVCRRGPLGAQPLACGRPNREVWPGHPGTGTASEGAAPPGRGHFLFLQLAGDRRFLCAASSGLPTPAHPPGKPGLPLQSQAAPALSLWGPRGGRAPGPQFSSQARLCASPQLMAGPPVGQTLPGLQLAGLVEEAADCAMGRVGRWRPSPWQVRSHSRADAAVPFLSILCPARWGPGLATGTGWPLPHGQVGRVTVSQHLRPTARQGENSRDTGQPALDPYSPRG